MVDVRHDGEGQSRLARIERKVDRLQADLTALLESRSTARDREPRPMLVGWNEIARFCRKAPRTLQRYRLLGSFPASRFGRHTVSSVPLIHAWLLAREQLQRQRRQMPAPARSLDSGSKGRGR